MSDQQDLFSEHGLARRSDPATSHQAAATVNVSRFERAVLKELITSVGGMTIKEVVISCRLPMESISPRFRPLASKGLIMDTGDKKKNPTGRNAIIWDITGLGIGAYHKATKEELRNT